MLLCNNADTADGLFIGGKLEDLFLLDVPCHVSNVYSLGLLLRRHFLIIIKFFFFEGNVENVEAGQICKREK